MTDKQDSLSTALRSAIEEVKYGSCPYYDTLTSAALTTLAAQPLSSLAEALPVVGESVAENQRHRNANLVRSVLDGWDEATDGALTDYINEEGFDAIPWRVAVGRAERAIATAVENERLRTALERIAEYRDGDDGMTEAARAGWTFGWMEARDIAKQALSSLPGGET